MHPHPSWVLHNFALIFLISSFSPFIGSNPPDYLWLWKIIFKTSPILFALCIFLFCAAFWGAWRLLTNGLAAKKNQQSLWSNPYWWLLLYSLPGFLFLITFYKIGTGHIQAILGWIGIIVGLGGIITVALLSQSRIPLPAEAYSNEDGETVLPLSAFFKNAPQEVTDEPTENINDKVVLNRAQNKTYPKAASQTVPSPKKDITTSDNVTPVLRAVFSADEEAVRTELEKHPEFLNTVHPYTGNTPLHIAILNGYTDIVRLLLAQEGIDTVRPNNNGKTALDLAAERNLTDIIELLKSMKK